MVRTVEERINEEEWIDQKIPVLWSISCVGPKKRMSTRLSTLRQPDFKQEILHENHSSRLQKLYQVRLAFRLGVLFLTMVMYFAYPESFDALTGFNFFHKFSWLHLLWLIWVINMVMQLVPSKGCLALGSLKQFKIFYKPAKELINKKELIPFFKKSELESLKVLLAWSMVVVGIGVLWAMKVLKEKELLLIAVVFYVCDLICVLFWCPLRVWIMKNRCCTTCRIFNWDHLMMFSPLIFISGVYSGSLVIMAALVFVVWEACFLFHPERFCEETNAALHCCNCTDKLCRNKKH